MNNLIIKKNNQITEIIFNRTKALNALNRETLKEFEMVLNTLREENNTKIVIISGAGDKAFVAGADIVEMKDLTALEGRSFSIMAQRAFCLVENSPQIFIAAVNGYALGGGCELAMACDIRIASTKAVFGQPEVSLGIIPGFAGTQRLPRLVGKGIASELVFTGKKIDAMEAYRIGLVNKVCEPMELMGKSYELANMILKNGSKAVALAKAAINRGLNMDNESAYSYEADLFGLCFSTEDQKEGMTAFVEKRKPEFKD